MVHQLAHSLSSGPETRTVELAQLLGRLEKTILHPGPERGRRLRSSEFERARVSSNLGFARDLLARAEQDAFAIKGPGKRHDVLVDLSRRGELLEQMYDRMRDLDQMDSEDERGESGEDEDEDVLAGVVVVSGESMNSEQQDRPHDREGDQEETLTTASKAPQPATTSTSSASSVPATTSSAPQAATSAATSASPRPAPTALPPPTQTSSDLRARKNAPEPQTHTTARAALFSRRGPSPPTATITATHSITAEAILDRQREEQEALSKRILENASRLKESSQMFSRLLAEDRDVVDRASTSMDATGRRMDAAGKKMGLLTRMTEGEGWWGRMRLYAIVYALIVACFVVVFASPKIRF